jgi:hypothetical protein
MSFGVGLLFQTIKFFFKKKKKSAADVIEPRRLNSRHNMLAQASLLQGSGDF